MSIATTVPYIRRLRLSPTLSAYIARQFAVWALSFYFALVGVLFLASTVDLLDRLATKDAPLGLVLQMSLFKLPFLSQEAMPFSILMASLACFWRLTRSNELVVTRSAGVSVWQFLMPAVGTAFVIGVVAVTALNPLASVLLSRYEHLEAKYIRNKSSVLSVSSGGLWLRQADGDGHHVIHAEHVTQNPMVLHDVTVFRLTLEDQFTGRIDATRAELRPDHWVLFDSWQSKPNMQRSFLPELEIETELTPEKVLESFARPESISFWALPEFIRVLEEAGFSAVRHKLQLHRLLANPFLLAAMVLLAATFSLRRQRRGRVGLVILTGVLAGFLLYFLSNFVFALGLSAKIPVVLAAWTPAGVSLMLGIAMLLHLEDG